MASLTQLLQTTLPRNMRTSFWRGAELGTEQQDKNAIEMTALTKM
jgi:hypothetical protein